MCVSKVQRRCICKRRIINHFQCIFERNCRINWGFIPHFFTILPVLAVGVVCKARMVRVGGSQGETRLTETRTEELVDWQNRNWQFSQLVRKAWLVKSLLCYYYSMKISGIWIRLLCLILPVLSKCLRFKMKDAESRDYHLGPTGCEHNRTIPALIWFSLKDKLESMCRTGFF